MDDHFTFIITLVSYMSCAWVAFKIFDRKKKGKKPESKDELLLWTLLLILVAGGGTLLRYLLIGRLLGG